MPDDTKNSKCIYTSATSNWLRIGPMKIQINSDDPYHAVIKELIYHNECDRIQSPLPQLLDNRAKEYGKFNGSSVKWIDIRVMKKKVTIFSQP